MAELTQMRLDRGLTISALAKEIDVSAAVIARAEAGHSIHPANAKKLADFYGFRVTELWPIEEVAA